MINMKFLLVMAAALLLPACEPGSIATPPTNTPKTKTYKVAVDIPQPTASPRPAMSRPLVSRNANSAASFAVVDIDQISGKVTKQYDIASASQNGDGTWAVVVDTVPSAATILIVHANDAAPVICINCDLPDNSVYVPLTDFEVKADVLSTVALEHFLTGNDEINRQELDEFIEAMQSFASSLAPMQSSQTLDEYLNQIRVDKDTEFQDVLAEATELPTKPINDTGVTLCGDYAYPDSTHNNKIDCYNSGVTKSLSGSETANGNDVVPSGQDALYGRDADPALNSDADGFKGMSFTKLDASGVPLLIQDGVYSPAGNEVNGTKWSCVRDNVTGLIWEEKTDDGGLRDKDWIYSWYNTNALTNGGLPGTANGGTCSGGSGCDTEKYVNDVNAAGLCGANDWRLPTLKELITLCVFDDRVSTAAIDTPYFPNYPSGYYWSSTVAYTSNYPGSSNIVRYISHSDCHTPGGARNFTNNIRLVR